MPNNNSLSKHPFDWRIVQSRYALRDRWLTLRVDSCQMPGGQVIEPYYVLEYPDYANVVALTPRREVVLVRQYRHGLGSTILEIPGGIVDAEDESPMVSARRELREETGYSCGSIEQLCSLSPNPANHTNRVHSFLALDARLDAGATPDANEQLEIVLLPLAQVRDMLRGGEFLQAMHACALFYALNRLNELGF